MDVQVIYWCNDILAQLTPLLLLDHFNILCSVCLLHVDEYGLHVYGKYIMQYSLLQREIFFGKSNIERIFGIGHERDELNA